MRKTSKAAAARKAQSTRNSATIPAHIREALEKTERENRKLEREWKRQAEQRRTA